ncbi:MAG TPA: aquaporin [Arachnia sp.]|nr:aquaporin [Arachnia sp.]HMT87432.1 aquaporin [Arachnia sp.]
MLILIFQPVSGAHFNPVVTLADRTLGASCSVGTIVAYVAAQVIGGIGGGVLANAMFGAATALSTTERATAGHLLGEVVATAGLILLIFALVRTGRAALVGPAVGAFVGAAYWFTSSTSFANPAVTIGRIFTDTFAGIAPASAWPFLAAQLVGAALGVGLVLLLFPLPRKARS